MSGFGTVTIDVGNPDPARAVHAFLRVMEKARSCGFVPRTEHTLAEQLLRGEVRVIFYSGGGTGGTMSLVESEDGLDADETFEVLMFIAEKQRDRRKRRKAEQEAANAQGIEAATAGETVGLDGNRESPVGNADAPNLPQDHSGDKL